MSDLNALIDNLRAALAAVTPDTYWGEPERQKAYYAEARAILAATNPVRAAPAASGYNTADRQRWLLS